MSTESNSTPEPGNALLSATTRGEMAVAAIVITFILFIVALVLCLRAKGYAGTLGSSLSRSRSSPVSAVSSNSHSHAHDARLALDPCILEKLPITVVFRSKGVELEHECAVCLSELRDGEETRFLPTCGHGFHVGCIDMWFQSNSTCPLCRNTVKLDKGNVSSDELSSLRIDVVDNDGSSSMMGSCSSACSNMKQRGMLVVEVPRRAAADGMTKSPVLERWRSLKRILSTSNVVAEAAASSSSSPRACDIEQGDPVGSAHL